MFGEVQCADLYCFVDVLIELDLFAKGLVLILEIDAEERFSFELTFQCVDLLLQIVIEMLKRLDRGEEEHAERGPSRSNLVVFHSACSVEGNGIRTGFQFGYFVFVLFQARFEDTCVAIVASRSEQHAHWIIEH